MPHTILNISKCKSLIFLTYFSECKQFSLTPAYQYLKVKLATQLITVRPTITLLANTIGKKKEKLIHIIKVYLHIIPCMAISLYCVACCNDLASHFMTFCFHNFCFRVLISAGWQKSILRNQVILNKVLVKICEKWYLLQM